MTDWEELSAELRRDPTSVNLRDLTTELWTGRRLGQSAQAAECAELALLGDPTNFALLNFVAMVFYDTNVKNLSERSTAPEIMELHQRSLRFRPQSHHNALNIGLYTYKLITFALARRLLELNRGSDALGLMRTVNYELLSAVPPRQVGGRELPSDRETYFLRLSRALELTSQNKELVDVARQAEQDISSSKNLKWVLLRAIRGALNESDLTAAEYFLRHSAIPKNDPTFLECQSDLASAKGDHVEAQTLLRRSLASMTSDLSFAVNRLAKLSRLLADSDRVAADSLTMLEASTRSNEGWPISESLRSRINSITTPPTEQWSRTQLQSWFASAKASTPRICGVVERHLNGGGSGFIRSDAGQSYYFSRPRNSTKDLPLVGQRVSFEVVDTVNSKTGKPAQKAVHLKSL